jgi:uncharacterized membrane protein
MRIRTVAATVAVAVVITALFAWIAFFAAFVVFDWAGGSFGGYGESGNSPAGWAVPAWVLVTLLLVVLDVFLVRAVYRKSRVK